MCSSDLAQLKDQLSRHLRAVERGAVIEVTDRERPIARIVPLPRNEETVTIIPATRPFTALRHKRYPPLRLRRTSLDYLHEERGTR